MAKYAAVYFSPDEERAYRTFLRAMAGLQIITMSKEQIKETMDIFVREKAGVMNRLVLDENQETMFRAVMKGWLPKKEYKVTNDPDDADFKNWLEERKRRI